MPSGLGFSSASGWLVARELRPADYRNVAIGIAGSGRVGTIALQECDRRSVGEVELSRAAECRWRHKRRTRR
jgi:hypothetical protein